MNCCEPTNRRTVKVLHLICSTGYYGAERWVLALVSKLSKDDIEVELAVTSEDINFRIEVLERFSKSYGLGHRIEMRTAFDVRIVKSLTKIIDSNGIDVIHTHGYKSDIVGLIVAKWANVKCMSTPHGFGENLGFKLRTYIRFGTFALRFFDRIVPLSTALCEDLINKGIPLDRISVIENAVDLEEIDRRVLSLDEKVIPSKGKKLGYVGRLVSGKRVDHIISVFDKLWSKDHSLELLIVGDGPERNTLETMVQGLPSVNSIQFLGYVEDRFVVMRSLDVFVMASISEGIPRCIMEALALELPVAAYDIPGVDELIKNYETGALAPSGDIIRLEKICEELLYDVNLAKRLGIAGRHLIERTFTAERMASDYSKLYREMLFCE